MIPFRIESVCAIENRFELNTLNAMASWFDQDRIEIYLVDNEMMYLLLFGNKRLSN
jgi:hypothetical protein